jgi:hypothetical protein
MVRPLRLLRLLAAILLLASSGSARAHLTPNSEISLAFGRTKIAADVVVPLSELTYATNMDIAAATGELTPTAKAMLASYFSSHMAVISPDGRRWNQTVSDIALSSDGSSPDILLKVLFMPPVGAPLRRFDLQYSAVIDHIANHFVLLLVRTDSDSGHLTDHPQMLGGLQQGNMTIRIDRGPGSAWRGFVSAVGLGMHHIAEGHDHLLFLIALLLPAPLLASGGRWSGYGGLRFTAHKLLAVVTAFTIGHSMTLIGGAFFGWKLPTQPVEVMIAVSILISAFHAWRPIFAGREALIAGSFGLVHGLAFATLIGRFGLEPMQKAQSILGFNIGIELVQIAVVAVVMPVLVVMARTSSYAAFRIGAAAFAGIAAIAWIIERVFRVDNIVGRAIDVGLGHAPWLLAALIAGAAAMVFADRRQAGSARPVA